MKTLMPILLLVWSAAPGWAALGQAHESVENDRQLLKGQLETRQMTGYTIEQITRGDGSVLREFVSPKGDVFGITWDGRTMPNLSELLGPSAAAFQQATAGMHRRGPLTVRVGDLVVQTGGHMQSFHVRAYRQDLVPSGISESVVR